MVDSLFRLGFDNLHRSFWPRLVILRHMSMQLSKQGMLQDPNERGFTSDQQYAGTFIVSTFLEISSYCKIVGISEKRYCHGRA
jgi:hypothetical protein